VVQLHPGVPQQNTEMAERLKATIYEQSWDTSYPVGSNPTFRSKQNAGLITGMNQNASSIPTGNG
jgi:hypothetical protein